MAVGRDGWTLAGRSTKSAEAESFQASDPGGVTWVEEEEEIEEKKPTTF